MLHLQEKNGNNLICTALASMSGAYAATSSCASSSLQVCGSAALRACLSRPATCSHMPWQAERMHRIGGREHVGIVLLLQGAQAPNPHLFVLTRPPIGHACAAGCLDWPFPAVLALSSTNPPSRMLAGASAASRTIGSVVEDVKTVVGASSVAAFSLEMTIASVCHDG